MHQQLLCLAIEKAFNKALALDLSGSDLTDLNGKSLIVDLQELGFVLQFNIVSSAAKEAPITVSAPTETRDIENTDCQIHTSLKTLKELRQTQALTELIKQGQLDIVGNIKIAQQFAGLVETLNIDWQSELAKNIGDVPTYKLQQLTKGIIQTVKQAQDQIELDVNEWLVHEKRLVVTKFELAEFSANVVQVAQHAEQLSTRVNKLINSPKEKEHCE